MRAACVLLLGLCLALPLRAEIAPSEVLDDPLLQTRAMSLYEELRCVKCQSEAIASSNAEWAQDARAIVRERLLAGDSDQDVLDFFHARYGDYVLMRTRFSGSGVLLWVAAPTLLLLGAIVAFSFMRRHSSDNAPSALSSAEEARVRRLLEDE